MNKKTIYLAGKVPKSDTEDFVDWRLECKKNLGEDTYNYISPLENRAEETDTFAVFGQCCSQIKRADIILVHANKKLGAGTSQEMLIAKYFGKAVITYLPKNTPHRKTNIVLTGKNIADWIHPFIAECSDIIVESYDELSQAVLELSNKKIKDILIVDEALSYYEKLYLKN
mgnify:CR=1 FL=1|jgi:hypothetical protein